VTADSGYPHDLAGDPAPPPAPPPNARVLGMALKAHARHLAALPEPDGVFGAAAWRLAGAVEQLRAEADAARPRPQPGQDGTIGDARHMEAGSGSDHNPWITAGGVGVVRAIDLTNDPALALHDVFERLRQRAPPAWAAAARRRRLSDPGRADHRRRLDRLEGLPRRGPARVPRARVRLPEPGRVRLPRRMGRVQN
jgi:hypothetical protein